MGDTVTIGPHDPTKPTKLPDGRIKYPDGSIGKPLATPTDLVKTDNVVTSQAHCPNCSAWFDVDDKVNTFAFSRGTISRTCSKECAMAFLRSSIYSQPNVAYCTKCGKVTEWAVYQIQNKYYQLNCAGDAHHPERFRLDVGDGAFLMVKDLITRADQVMAEKDDILNAKSYGQIVTICPGSHVKYITWKEAIPTAIFTELTNIKYGNGEAKPETNADPIE